MWHSMNLKLLFSMYRVYSSISVKKKSVHCDAVNKLKGLETVYFHRGF